MIGSISSVNVFDNLSKEWGSASFSNEELTSIVINLENDIADGTWLRKNYAYTDIQVMPALITQAKTKYPGINLNFVTSPQDLPVEIKNAIEQGIESSRFIVNMGEGGIHFCVIDHKHINGKTSLILFEPFYKHTQGERRLNEYLNMNPQEMSTVVNKKNETILHRFNNNLAVTDGKELSISAHKKRITEYKALLKP